MITANFNIKLNNSYNDMDKFILWKEYRNEIDELIKKAINISKTILEKKTNDKLNNVLVIGAGNCNDFTITTLASEFNKVYLMDVDIESINRGILKQQAKEENIILIQRDITFIDNFIIEGINIPESIKRALEKQEINIYKVAFNNYIEKYKRLKEKELIDSKFDLIIILPIYTQIFYYQMLEELQKHHEYIETATYNEISQELLQGMVSIINNINHLLLSNARRDTIFIAIQDIIEDKKNGEFVREFNRGNDFIEMMTEYTNNYGMGIGEYAMMDLSSKLNIITENYLLWPYSNDRFFVNKALIGKKSNI